MMKRILITGMSGTGKSSVIEELSGRGFDAVDADLDEWSEWTMAPGPDDPGGARPRPDWTWREDRVRRLLGAPREAPLFVSGCATNQVKFYDVLDGIVLLNAPLEVILDRVATRTNNPYGKREEERRDIARYFHSVVPLLRKRACAEWDTSTLTVSEVADRLEALALRSSAL